MRRALICLAAVVGCNSEPAAVPGPDSPASVVPAATEQPPAVTPIPAKKHPQPTAAQIAEWERFNARPSQPLQLLACYDGFGDAFVQCAAVSPDGKQFALGGAKLTLWNVNEAQPIANLIADLKEEKDIERPMRSIAFSPNGELLAAGDQRGMLRVWNPADQSERFAIRAHDARLTELAISPDSKTIATTSYSGEVRLWDSADGSKVKSFKADEQEIHALVFLTEKLLATAGRDATVWNVETGEKVASLSTGRLLGPALEVSADHKLLAYADADGTIKFWDVEKQAKTDVVLHGGAQRIAISADGQWVATYAERTIRIFNAATQNLIQVIDADGDRTTGLQWLPGGALLVASENGIARLWGAADQAADLGAPSIESLPVRGIEVDTTQSFSPMQFGWVIDVRSFPRLPGAVPMYGGSGTDTYNAPVTQADAELFYRWACERGGWMELPADPMLPGLNFFKQGCRLHVSLNPAAPPTPGRDGDLQVSLRFVGNVDVRKLPQVSPIDSKSNLGSAASVSYRTKQSLTEVEVELLKGLHAAGWTPYSRLAASSVEDPQTRHLALLQGGSVLTVYLGHPADAADEVFVQLGVHPTTKALPVPADAGWIEFDNSTNLQLVANTSLKLESAIGYYDAAMTTWGWNRREAGRHVDEKERKAWLPYFRGQQDVLIRFVAMPEGGTRVIVGEAERSSWQLAKPKPVDPAKAQVGIEAADFGLPKGSASVKFDVDDKKIEFELADSSPLKLVEWFVQQMESLEWKRDGAGVLSDDYSLVTFKQGKAEIQLRARAEAKKATAAISGDGLLWTKPLPTAPVRISYETWLRRAKKRASLEYLDEFAEEMRKIPPTKP